jgi:hypothetical protein
MHTGFTMVEMWTNYCLRINADPMNPSMINIINFFTGLHSEQNLTFSTVNIYRATIFRSLAASKSFSPQEF